MVVGESRTELLAWLNEILDLNYTKVEQCGTGAAYCQIMDTVVGGVPMSKVKFEAKNEYDYRQNMKVLQSVFNKHNITKVIDVERLVRCRLQDNLELLQWFKRFWSENKGVNDSYDASSRRKLSGSSNIASARPVGSRASSGSSSTSRRTTMTNNSASSSNTSTHPTRNISTERTSLTPKTPQNGNKLTQLNRELTSTVQELKNVNEELQEYKLSVESLETERNFYFNKLREIEILTQNITDLQDSEKSDQLQNISLEDFTKKIQTILYSTEEGFQEVSEDDNNIDMIDNECF